MKDYEFEWDRIFKSQGHTGPYLQFAHARLCGGTKSRGCCQSRFTYHCQVYVVLDANLDLLVEDEALELVITFSRYPEAIQTAAQQSEPSSLVTYLFDLSHAISVAHNVLREANQKKLPRLVCFFIMLHGIFCFASVHCCRIALGNGMKLLGLNPLERIRLVPRTHSIDHLPAKLLVKQTWLVNFVTCIVSCTFICLTQFLTLIYSKRREKMLKQSDMIFECFRAEIVRRSQQSIVLKNYIICF